MRKPGKRLGNGHVDEARWRAELKAGDHATVLHSRPRTPRRYQKMKSGKVQKVSDYSIWVIDIDGKRYRFCRCSGDIAIDARHNDIYIIQPPEQWEQISS